MSLVAFDPTLTVVTVPGWDKLKSTANDMWGDYQREIKTNNPDVSAALYLYHSGSGY